MIFKKTHLIFFLLLIIVGGAIAQNTGVKPQFWNNASVVWEVNNKLFIGNTLSYNVLFDKDLPWSELSYNGVAVRRINSFILVNGGAYFAWTNQSSTLKTFELRPYLGIRFTTSVDKRWSISNLSRLEWRNIYYSNDDQESTLRFRNRTTAVLAINNKKILENNTLTLFAYFEAFHNFDTEVVERYFTTLKYKGGFAYRFSRQWRIDIGVLFNDATNTIREPSNPIANIVTNVILECGITYGILQN